MTTISISILTHNCQNLYQAIFSPFSMAASRTSSLSTLSLDELHEQKQLCLMNIRDTLQLVLAYGSRSARAETCLSEARSRLESRNALANITMSSSEAQPVICQPSGRYPPSPIPHHPSPVGAVPGRKRFIVLHSQSEGRLLKPL